MGWRRGKFTLFMLAFEIIFIILFAIYVKYDPGADAYHDLSNVKNVTAYLLKNNRSVKEGQYSLPDYYAIFQDVHVMMFVGFGFLMTFLKRYGFSSVGLNMLVAAFCIQWSMLVHGFFHLHDGHIEINVMSMLLSDFASAAVLITFGAMLGKLSPLQFVIMALFEIPIFVTNEWLGLEVFKTVDVGGSMFVHVFGAFFGLACSLVLYTKDIEEQSHKEAATYDQDLFSMIGTIFLWLFWPSFNAALAPGDDKVRAVLNTYLSLAACAVVAIAMSAAVSKDDKFNMEHLQNATLAGGVAVGTSADMMVQPWGAMTIGAIAAIISVFGFRFIPPLEAKLRLHDTCGVVNLHGLPGVMAGVVGVIIASQAQVDEYGPSLYQIFPARVPEANTTEFLALSADLTVEPGLGRTASQQASYQAVALAHTLAVACVGGLLTGLVLRIPIWNQPQHTEIFDDEPWFEIPYGYPPEYNDEEEAKEAARRLSQANGGNNVYTNNAADIEFTKV